METTAPERLVFLVGFMGSGKTSVGRLLAARLGVEFFDTDAWIEKSESRSVAELFQQNGEAHFRACEAKALAAACQLPRGVVATGGGLFASPEHRETIRNRGVSIWLDTPLDRIWERCEQSDTRPLWGTREELAALLQSRLGSYAEADWRIAVANRDLEEIVREAERLLPQRDREG